MSDPSDIASFYRNKGIFITGATGFMGKVLVEKLLRGCPGITNIYVLMRPKKGNDVKTRMTDLINAPVFDWLRKERPDALTKVIPVAGDITMPKLGLSQSDYKLLTEKVTIVFHSAATVRFDETLKEAVAMNMTGTKSLVQLCQNIKNLDALVHVSTAYCNCDRNEVSEVIYPAPDDPEKILKFAECMDKELMENLTPHILKNHPNTYIFTKALAEHIFLTESAGLPAAIVRPSIVTAAFREPLPGWIDNLNGPTGLLAGAGKGILRTFHGYRDFIADLIPVDIAINLLITVAWYTALTRPSNITIYNCTSGQLNPIRWADIETMSQISIKNLPFNDIIWYPGGSFKKSKFINNICSTTFQIIPAYIFDTISRISGKKPMMVQIQKKFQRAISVLEFFTTHEWLFYSTNVRILLSKMSEHDRRLFDFDVKNINWRTYMDNYVEGIKLYVLKEDPVTASKAKTRLRRMYYLHKLTQILTLILISRLLLTSADATKKLWCSLWSVSLYLARFLVYPITN